MVFGVSGRKPWRRGYLPTYLRQEWAAKHLQGLTAEAVLSDAGEATPARRKRCVSSAPAPALAQMWAGVSPVPVQMWAGTSPVLGAVVDRPASAVSRIGTVRALTVPTHG